MRRFVWIWLGVLLALPFLATIGYIHISEQDNQRMSAEQSQLNIMADGKKMGVSKFLTGVLACQISPEYELETIKAQAIIARTIVYERAAGRNYIDASEIGMEWRDEKERAKMWGIHYLDYNQKIEQAVLETDGSVIRYEDELITPAYFLLGSGRTRSSFEAWGVDIPWLQSVDSEWDQSSAEYETKRTQTKRQFVDLLRLNIKDFECPYESVAATCQIMKTDSAGYVTQIQIGNKLLSGEDFRYIFDLPSSCFQIDFEKNTVNMTVCGKGHGVGFDQYGANEQAMQGKSCDELLRFYFVGVKVGE